MIPDHYRKLEDFPVQKKFTGRRPASNIRVVAANRKLGELLALVI